MSMWPTVEAIWVPYNQDLEGIWSSMYLDNRGLVTTAMGCIADPIHLALAMPWKIGDRDATQEEITNDWKALKSRPNLADVIAAHQAPLTSVRLRSDAINVLIQRRLKANYDYLRAHLMPQIDEFPADAQLGILSTAWAIGAAFDKTDPPRPALIEACNARDWIAAKVHSRLREAGNPGVALRNRRQETCFDNAQSVKERALDPSWLWYPNRAPKDDDLKTVALKALELGIARESVPPKNS